MEPSSDFWSGVGSGVAKADGWMVVVSVAIIAIVIGLAVVYGKYIAPSTERVKMRELDIREKEAKLASDRIQSQMAIVEGMRGIQESNDALAIQSAAIIARFDEAGDRSRGMGKRVEHIDSTASENNEILKRIDRRLIGGEGTD